MCTHIPANLASQFTLQSAPSSPLLQLFIYMLPAPCAQSQCPLCITKSFPSSPGATDDAIGKYVYDNQGCDPL